MCDFNKSRFDFLSRIVKDSIDAGISGELPFVMCVSQNTKKNEGAAKYIKKNTREYYLLASHQYTITPLNKLEDILNEEGENLYNQARKRYERGEYKDTITEYRAIYDNSGSWVSNPESPFYDKKEIGGSFNSFQNLKICGITESTGGPITTSPAIFITPEWCLTSSGSLYKLGIETDPPGFF